MRRIYLLPLCAAFLFAAGCGDDAADACDEPDASGPTADATTGGDTAEADAGTDEDATMTDTAEEDAAVEDASVEDASMEDVSMEDVSMEDASMEDASMEDASMEDASTEECDLESVELLDFEPWRREEGWWVGEYTLLGADGDPSTSANWPYRYDHYRGFIHLEVIGNAIRQRNVFLYPPLAAEGCTGEEGEVVGSGECGVNGNEKVFSADQTASDCDGNLAGPFFAFGMELSTETTLIGDDTVLYQVRLPDGGLTQNQLTSLPGNDTRVRTAQGLFQGNPTYASFYRERKVTQEEFFEILAETRTEYNILEDDYCGYDSGNMPTEASCDEHFGLE